MRNILLFLCLCFIACDDEIHPSNDEVIIAETPPEGMKIKQKEGNSSQEYFYHNNGFIDSIYTNKGYIATEKFIYNKKNQITEVRVNYRNANASEFTTKITNYTYNDANQIILMEVYDKNNVLIDIKNYTYNADGTLYNPVKIVENENLVKENAPDTYITFKYDANPNPYYNIYPKAYKILNYINKNNLKLKTLKNSYQNLQWSHELSYNDNKYVTYEIIRNYENGYETNKFHYYP
ncbi:hypothetical protein H1R17_10480 [Flavobacterium sp. xlx-214]|uniref:hypothetical protein n=1 Tax=unclassified Flavobacterium TaxID=196869 RepID=UPI0013D74EF3|nr:MULTISPECIES: hypothetical protein [unclassified Flavobacterium]MBA5791641.1 hypothetical protein [Flavobacterium sp. xlx-221]QMI82885.1 hypothetical protein H1R17_10480 [Flavobacterium sp. xlx-214]